MKKIIRAKSPVRLGLGGGGTDVSPYCDEYGGAVLNVTINQYAYATLVIRDDQKVVLRSRDLNDEQTFDCLEDIVIDGRLDLLKALVMRLAHNLPTGFELTTECNVPPRSGLGSSASVFAAAIEVFNHLEEEHRLSRYEISELAYQIERVDLGNLGGRQDQFATVFGGVNFIEFRQDDFARVEALQLNHHVKEELQESLLLFHIGDRGDSGNVIEDQKKNTISDETALNAMHRAKSICHKMKKALFSGNVNLFGELLHQSWMEKKKFSSKISNPFIDELYATARANHAIGGKISGAGGGGHMFFVVESGKNQQLIAALEKMGVKYVPFAFDWRGARTWEAVEYGGVR